MNVCMHVINIDLILQLFSLKMTFGDEMEIGKGSDDMSDHENEVDQVALESEQENQPPQKILYQHNLSQPPQGPGPARSE